MMPETRGEHAGIGIPPIPLPLEAGTGPLRPTAQAMFAWYAPGFSDLLGDRLLLFDNTDGRPLELLRLRADFAQAAGFEASLRQRALELAGFVDPRFARVCRVDRLPDPGGGLAIVSEHVEGRRLSEALALARQQHGRLAADLVLALVTELVSAVAALHRLGPDVAHCALGPERLVLAPGGRLLVTEYVLGLALRQVAMSHPAICEELRVPLGRASDGPRCDQQGDVLQVGAIALSLLLGRAPTALDNAGTLVGEAVDRTRLDGWDPSRSMGFGTWLRRVVQAEGSAPFANAAEASAVLNDLQRRAGAFSPPAHAIARFITESSSAGGFADSSPAIGSKDEAAIGASHAESVALPTGVPVLPEGPSERGTETNASGDGLLGQRAELLAFPSEASLAARSDRPGLIAAVLRRSGQPAGGPSLRPSLDRRTSRAWLVGLLALLVVIEGVYIGSRLFPTRRAAASPGMLRLESNPPGAAVSIDGKPRGATPTSLRLDAGRHAVELRLGTRRRAMSVTLQAGEQASQIVDLPAEVSGVGSIEVRSEPSGARVSVDGQPRGATPLLLPGLAVGHHDVRVDKGGASITQSVSVEQAAVASVFVPFARTDAPAPGWLSIESPLELQVDEDEQLLGTSRSERIMLPAGRHEVSLVNDEVGFRTSEEVVVPIGRTADLEVSIPAGTIDINASPWAEVSIDGAKVGETPLAGVPARLGRHRVTFKHPTLGERTVDCLVTARQPARVSADLRK